MTSAAVIRWLPKQKGIAAFAFGVNSELNVHGGAGDLGRGERHKPEDGGALEGAVWP